jgi:hypothetical protein
VENLDLGVSYFGNRISGHYAALDLPEIVNHGCNFVVHTLSEEDFWFYPETMRELIDLSHQAGLNVFLDPWGVGGVFAGETFSRFLLDEPKAWQINSAGAWVPKACLRSPIFREFMQKWTNLAIELNTDGILWDEPQLSLPVNEQLAELNLTCCCLECRDTYWQQYREVMPAEVTPNVLKFREDTVIDFLEEICGHANRFGLKNAICLKATEDITQGVNDWDRVADIHGLDILGVTPFWHLYGQDPKAFVGYWAKRVAAICAPRGIESQVWLQGFQIGAGREMEILHASEAAIQAGVTNLAVWGIYGCSHMSALSSERPAEVWKVVGDTFNQLRARK